MGLKILISEGEKMPENPESDFGGLIRDYTQRFGIVLELLEERGAVISLPGPSGVNQPIFISRFGKEREMLEFRLPSVANANSMEELDTEMAKMLLYRNSQVGGGFWCIDTVDKKYTFCVIYNIEMGKLTPEEFQLIVKSLVYECERFEAGLAMMVAKIMKMIGFPDRPPATQEEGEAHNRGE